MADLPTTTRVVIIGGGVVGVSCLYHLALRGWTDCVLLEKNELTSGSTWHAAGNVPTFSASWSIMLMQRYSADLYRDLGTRVDYPMNYHVTGSLRLAHSAQRMMEFEKAAAMARHQGSEMVICTPAELKDRYPFLETHDLEGGLYDPYDGDIDPAQLTQALAKGARDLGAKIVRFCPVTNARRDKEEWVIDTDQGTIRCQYVVNAAGYRAREVGAMFGRDVPMVSMAHQYLLTDQIPELEQWSKDAGRKLPLLRDVDSSYYLRQEKSGLNLGPYERNCRAHWVTPDDPMPDDFSFQLYPDDLDRLEWYMEDAMARVPILGSAGINKVINGPIPYTPDGNPLIGPMPGVPNAFEACVFTFGIAQGGGAGKVLAEWVVDGGTDWDMWSCDPRRFTGYTDQDHCLQKAMEIYGHEYAMHFPRHTWPAGRDRRLSPVHDRIKARGAQFGVYGGWERANWFAAHGDDTSEAATQNWWREGPWFARIGEECLAVRDAAGILDLPGFSRYMLQGPGVAAWLSTLITGKVPSVGRIGLGYFADDRGRVVSEMSMARLAEDKILLITAAAAQWHDRDWLSDHLPAGGAITLRDQTEDFSCQILSGPASRAILADLCDADLNQPWLSWQHSEIAGRPVELFRVSFAGELGWEIHSAIADTPTVFDAVWEAGHAHGLKPFGMFALDSLRLEKGYKAWKMDLSAAYTVLESGLERFVDWSKPAYKGKLAMETERQAGVKSRCVTLVLEDGDCDAPAMAPVWHEGKAVGEVTSAGYGHRVQAHLAQAIIAASAAEPGTRLEVEVFGKRLAATVQPEGPVYDPENIRLRS